MKGSCLPFGNTFGLFCFPRVQPALSGNVYPTYCLQRVLLSTPMGDIIPLSRFWKTIRNPYGDLCRSLGKQTTICLTMLLCGFKTPQLFHNMLITLMCANTFTPGRATRWPSRWCGFRCTWFLAPGSLEHQWNTLYRGRRLLGVRIYSHLEHQFVNYQADAVSGTHGFHAWKGGLLLFTGRVMYVERPVMFLGSVALDFRTFS